MTLALDASGFHLADPDIDCLPQHAERLAWRATQVESKPSQRASKMPHGESGPDSTESEARRARQAAAEDARPVVAKWVEVELPRHAYRRGLAYGAVARLFACHESWIRRLLGRQVGSFDADLYKRIMLSEAAADRLLIARHAAELKRLGAAPDVEVRDAG